MIQSSIHKGLSLYVRIFFFVLAAVFVSNTLVPEYLACVDAEVLELVESDKEAEEEKKESQEENEKDEYLHTNLSSSDWNLTQHFRHNHCLANWASPALSIATPPPEQV